MKIAVPDLTCSQTRVPPTTFCYLFVPLMTLGVGGEIICWWRVEGRWEKEKKICFVYVLVSSSKCSRVYSCLLKLHYHLISVFYHTKEPLFLRKKK